MLAKQVSNERWQLAQQHELHAWVEGTERTGWRRIAWRLSRPILTRLFPQRFEGTDWNEWWAQKFDDYKFLPSTMENLLELGCGPFTNTRIILRRGHQARHVYCSDPLVRHYVQFRGRWLAKQYAHASVFIDDHPAEECPFATDYFDAVVMINVLDHVRDADECIRQALRVTKPGGFFIIGQDLVDPAKPEDPMHPIRLIASDIEEHLGGFEPVIHKLLPSEESREQHYSTLIYAGRKKQ